MKGMERKGEPTEVDDTARERSQVVGVDVVGEEAQDRELDLRPCCLDADGGEVYCGDAA